MIKKSFLLLLISTAFFILLFLNPGLVLADWPQDAHDAQRTGYTPEEPEKPWTLLWTWNGPDANGGTGSHFYDVGSSLDHGGNSPMWEGRTVTGGDYIYVPALDHGLYALRKSNGTVGWNYNPGGTSMKATPAYDPATGHIFVGASNGRLYKINASNGSLTGTYNAGSPLNKSVLLVGSYAYVVTDSGDLHKINTTNMSDLWVYSANAGSWGIATPPTYSASRDVVVYATNDLYVHAVNANGTRKWRVKPTPHLPGFPYEFDGYWPVIAEQHGVVFVRMRLTSGDLNGPGPIQNYYSSNSENQAYLVSNPGKKNLFALDLDDGSEAFVPAVGFCSVEGVVNNTPKAEVGPVPVIKVLPDGKEVAYEIFRAWHKDSYGYTTDGHMGEMVLDGNTVSGLSAGYLRFISFIQRGYYIIDALGPLTMAGNTIFHSGWGFIDSARITDRSAGKGLSYDNKITSERHPVIIRRMQTCSNFNSATHWTSCGLTLYDDGTYRPGPGWWVYWNVCDPPTPFGRGAYSEGILPRYTYVADGLVVIEGNGGDLFVLRHSGSSSPSPSPSPFSSPSPSPTPSPPSYEKGDVDHNGRVDFSDALMVLRNYGKNPSQVAGYHDPVGDNQVNGMDFGYVVKEWGK